ncbi:transcriptional-regulating factor 1-like isoform X2 [Cottoperca gobio]|uniref:Transcriptional-regulating factor 1-like isoform X2 n=1 Tax=Cottoperca gobio TaxID=56716 RepID=A0A6J2PB41_COTGO|nr:transcriptional-regulating factor 1-like isoform X2 [Cottoperca gobio]
MFQVICPPQQPLYNQNPEPCLNNPDWSCRFLYQNQFSTGVTHHGGGLDDTHIHFSGGVYGQTHIPGALQDTWGPTPPQVQSSLLGGWSPAEDFFYQENYPPQPFCSPTTPGPSPHYPQTPAISSPGAQIQQTGNLDFHVPTSRESCDGSLMTPDPGQQHPYQTSPPLLQNQSELIQIQAGLLPPRFVPQAGGWDLSGAGQLPGLAAGLSWREEGGGGILKMKRAEPENSEVRKSRLLCTVCKRDFRSLPALNGHMRSHSGSRSATWLKKGEDSGVQPSVSMVMPVCVPVQSKGPSKAGQKSRPSAATRGAEPLYRSLLHQEEDEGDGARYTPPPMLCPLRAGSGLYRSLATRRQQRASTVRLHNAHNEFNDLVAMVTAPPPPGTLINKPRINEGRGFQAEIPQLRVRKYADSDSHNALLLWTPWDELECPINQQRVAALLSMVRSSVVPGGGVSPESALHVLSECRGDFLLTIEKLLTPGTTNINNINHTAQQHPSVRWSTAERRLLVKSLQLHHKDFSRIQKTVHTKSLSECVEFYYLWKKKSLRTPAGPTLHLLQSGKRQQESKHETLQASFSAALVVQSSCWNRDKHKLLTQTIRQTSVNEGVRLKLQET